MAGERRIPYVGPVSFEEADRPYFFGREQEAMALFSLVLTNRLVLFHATSGAGKSSLINTQLIPSLRGQGFMPIRARFRSAAQLDGLENARNVYVYALLSQLSSEVPAEKLQDLSINSFLSRHHLLEVTRDEEAIGPDPARILIIDQFEEFVTGFEQYWQQRQEFFRQLRAALVEDPLLWILLVMREDYVNRLGAYAHLVPGKLAVRYHMEQMREKAALLAITGPAEKLNSGYEPGAAERLLHDLRQVRVAGQSGTMPGEFIEPVQLQLACRALWERVSPAPGETITMKHVATLADVDKSLGDYYDAAIAQTVSVAGVGESTLRDWFETKLITEAETRDQVLRGDKETAGISNSVVDFLVKRFFLLRSASVRGGTWYELVHDRFIQPILKANRSWWNEQDPLLQAVRAWQQSGEADSHLATGELLERIRPPFGLGKWRRLDPTVVTFLNASEKKDKRLKEAQQALIERLNRERRQRRRFAGLSVVAGLFAVLFVVAAVVAFNRASVEQEAAQIAEVAFATSVAAGTRASLSDARADAANAAAFAAINDSSEEQLAERRLLLQQVHVYTVTITAQAMLILPSITTTPQFVDTETPVLATPAATVTAISSVPTSTPLSVASSTLEPTLTPNPRPSRDSGIIIFELMGQDTNRDGRISFSDDHVLARIDVDEPNSVQSLTGDGYSARDPAWSPDGRQIVFASNQSGNFELYIMDSDGGSESRQMTKLTDHIAVDRGPSWSRTPDGEWIVFFSERSGRRQIWRIRPDRSDLERLTLDDSRDAEYPEWSPDGTQIAYEYGINCAADNCALWLMDADGGNPRQLVSGRVQWPTWSPTGDKIAYTKLTSGVQGSIFVWDRNNQEEERLTDMNSAGPTWSADGNRIAFLAWDQFGPQIWVMNADGSEQRQVTSGGGWKTRPVWTPLKTP